MSIKSNFLLAMGLVLGTVPPLMAQKVHQIQIDGDRTKGRYRFDPARVSVSPGDIIRFVAGGGAPHSVVFDSTGLSAAQIQALNQAIPDRMSLLSGPLLTEEGQAFQIRVPGLPPGNYRFYCLPHRAYRSEGLLVVVKAGGG